MKYLFIIRYGWIILFFIFAKSAIYSQEFDTVCFTCSGTNYSFEMPKIHHDTIIGYEEGFFRIYMMKNPWRFITLLCGHNVNLPHIKDSSSVIINHFENEKIGDFFGVDTVRNNYWRVQYYKGEPFYISFHNEPLGSVKVMNDIINSIKVVVIK